MGEQDFIGCAHWHASGCSKLGLDSSLVLFPADLQRDLPRIVVRQMKAGSKETQVSVGSEAREEAEHLDLHCVPRNAGVRVSSESAPIRVAGMGELVVGEVSTESGATTKDIRTAPAIPWQMGRGRRGGFVGRNSQLVVIPGPPQCKAFVTVLAAVRVVGGINATVSGGKGLSA